MSLPSTSVIIASRNRPGMLYDTVQSILSGDEVPTEIIIIDQSDQANPALAELGPCRGCAIGYHWSHTVGTSKARNLALQMARYDYLVVIDDDMFVSNDWLTNLTQGLANGRAKCAASGKVVAAQTSEGRFAPSTRMNEEPAIYQGRVWKDVLWSNNMAMHRSVLNDVGFFDERMGPGTPFPAGEDNDYGLRILEAGYQILYVPSAVVYHRDWRPKQDYVRLRWNYGVGRGAYYAKYFSLSDGYQFRRMIDDIRNHVLSSFNSQNHRDPLRRYGDLVLALGILIGAACWLARWGGARQ